MRETFRQSNSATGGHKDLRLGQIVYALVFYNISFSWLLPLDGFQFIFLLRDSENYLYYVGKMKQTIFFRNFVCVLRTATTRHMVSFIDFYFHFLANFQT